MVVPAIVHHAIFQRPAIPSVSGLQCLAVAQSSRLPALRTLRGTEPLRSRSFHISPFRQAQKGSKPSISSKKDLPKVPEYRPSNRKPVQPPPRNYEVKPPRDNLRGRRIPMVLGGSVLFTLAMYSGYLYTRYFGEPHPPTALAEQQDISARYDEIADDFDGSIDSTERWMGLKKLRKRLAKEAVGDVCEVSIGTGRNLLFYDWNFSGLNAAGESSDSDETVKRGKIKSFTAVDKSWQMLKIAKSKFDKEYYGYDKCPIQWVVQDAALPLPEPPNSNNPGASVKKYDTIIQTMGLCSVSDPVALLRNLGASVKEDGKILLLEHGQGSSDWINAILNRGASEHAKKFGCWWNRDIGAMIDESGLEVVNIERKHFGTTWWIELKPKSNR